MLGPMLNNNEFIIIMIAMIFAMNGVRSIEEQLWENHTHPRKQHTYVYTMHIIHFVQYYSDLNPMCKAACSHKVSTFSVCVCVWMFHFLLSAFALRSALDFRSKRLSICLHYSLFHSLSACVCIYVCVRNCVYNFLFPCFFIFRCSLPALYSIQHAICHVFSISCPLFNKKKRKWNAEHMYTLPMR